MAFDEYPGLDEEDHEEGYPGVLELDVYYRWQSDLNPTLQKVTLTFFDDAPELPKVGQFFGNWKSRWGYAGIEIVATRQRSFTPGLAPSEAPSFQHGALRLH